MAIPYHRALSDGSQPAVRSSRDASFERNSSSVSPAPRAGRVAVMIVGIVQVQTRDGNGNALTGVLAQRPGREKF